MGDYNLHALNPRDFQHLAQAIARKHIAAGVTAFGDGKDGARDLAYRGKMSYPSAADPWNGYLVMGCKFRQRGAGDPRKETAWALKQLESDLRKFANRRRNLSKPDYYLFVTNVPLSGVATTGGRDKCSQLLDAYSAKLKLKGHSVWDYNDLRGFLDGDRDLRRAYGHFITVGDVLGQMMDVLSLHRADFADVMHTFLQKELITDTSAKLQSAGEDPDVQIPLANVFVDLPFADSAEAAVLANDEEEQSFPKVVRTLLNAGSLVLRKSQLDEEDPLREVPGLKISKFVIVGGPGQGKSTFGQFLCQLYRASILRDRPAERLDERVPGVLKQLETQQREVGGLPLTRRFPIRLELRNFSSALASDPQLTLLEYIRRDIARLGSSTLLIEDLKSWLNAYPWVLVLDGLDEVPPSSNRNEVLREVDSLRVDLASQNSDILIVATTRPQSYSREFSGDLFRHLYLTPLSPTQALHYGRKLAEARCGTDERRKDELMRSLEKACKSAQTSRLMQSPLQVTIMATLLEDTGEPPQQRYRLFAEYYRTIYKRETRRKLLGGILTERQKDVDTIHAQVGLILQAAGENTTVRGKQPGGHEIDSALSDDQFRKLVRRRLDKIGVSSTKHGELLDRISDGSLQRLVFLVRPREGWVKFDVTSLKEFMAAEALMDGSDDDIRKRLQIIAPTSYWRNVFQFTVGKCFAEREYLLDNLVSLCAALNEDRASAVILGDVLAGQASKATLWGSQLALDILSDGTTRQHPGYESCFARIALQLVRSADPQISARLASIFHDDLKEVYIEVIADRLGQSSFWSRLGAWYLLTGLADRDISWAVEIVEDQWPTEVEDQRAILLTTSRRTSSNWSRTKLNGLVPRVDPMMLFGYLRPYLFSEGEPEYTIWQSIWKLLASRKGQFAVENKSTWKELVTTLSLAPFHIGVELLLTIKDIRFEDPHWFPIVSGARFGASPSSKTLGAELEWLAQCWSPSESFLRMTLPWPLAVCLDRAETKQDLERYAKSAEQGLLGDAKDWALAEQRWETFGIEDGDFVGGSDGDLPLTPEIVRVGFPFAASNWTGNDTFSWLNISSVIERLSSVNSESRSWLASVILHSLDSVDPSSPPQVSDLERLHSYMQKRRASWGRFWLASTVQRELVLPTSSDTIEFFDWVGRKGAVASNNHPNCELSSELTQQFSSNPDQWRGLLRIIAEFAQSGCRPSVQSHILQEARAWNSQARADAICLGLVKTGLDGDTIRALANEISTLPTVFNPIWRALKIASNSSPTQGVQFALAVLEEVSENSEDHMHALDAARRTLNEFLTNRPSLLHEPLTWSKLNLFEKV